MNKTITRLLYFFMVAFAVWSCSKKEENQKTNSMENTIEVSDYGITKNGDSIKTYTLKNKNGMNMYCIEARDVSLIQRLHIDIWQCELPCLRSMP